MHVWGQEVFGNSVLPTQLCSELKTALKNSLFEKKKGEEEVTPCGRKT